MGQELGILEKKTSYVGDSWYVKKFAGERATEM
jgi:hypothetical protein